jgi:ketosteroid isomerase-like protein
MGSNAIDSARSIFKVIETGDPALAAEVVDPGFRNREAVSSPAACATRGPAGVLATSAWMRSAFTDLRFPVLDTAVDDESGQVFVRVHMQGRHTGPFVLFRDGKLDKILLPTGRKLDYEQIHVLATRDGKVVGHEAVRDDLTMLGQLGALPPTPAGASRLVAWKLTGRAQRAAAAVSALAAEAAQGAGAGTGAGGVGAAAQGR